MINSEKDHSQITWNPKNVFSRTVWHDSRDWRGYLFGAGLVVLVTGLAYAAKALISPTSSIMFYLLGVVVTAILWGLGPSIMVCVLSEMASDYFFVGPKLGFGSPYIQDIITLIVLTVVGVAISYLTSQTRWQTKEARQHGLETYALYVLSQSLAVNDELKSNLDTIMKKTREILGYNVVIFLPDEENKQMLKPYLNHAEPISGENEITVATWSFQHKKKAGRWTEMFPDVKAQYIPLITPRGIAGVMAVSEVDAPNHLTAPRERILNAFANIAAMAIERSLLYKNLVYLASFPKLNPQPIIEINTSEHFLYVNPAADEAFPDLKTKGLEHPYLTNLKTLIEPLQSGGKDILTRQVAVDTRYFQQNILLTDGDSNVRVYGVDITEGIKFAEEAKKIRDTQAAVEKIQTAFLDSISHELRTPLASVIGILSSLREEFNLSDATSKNLIQVAHEEAKKLNNSITNLLDISRIEAGAIRLNRQLSDVRDIINMTLDELGDRASGRSISVDVATGLPFVSVDSGLIVKVLHNLMDNALKYSSPDSPIDVSARRVTQAIEIEVADRGVGIPPDNLPYIFHRFYRAHHDVSGIGLGLSICKGIIDAHGGQITAENRSGSGTIFRLTLPLVDTTGQK